MKLPSISWPKNKIEWLEAIFSGVLTGIVLTLWLFLMGSYVIGMALALVFIQMTGLFSDYTIRIIGLFIDSTFKLMALTPTLLYLAWVYTITKNDRIKKERGSLKEGLSYV